MTKPYDYQSLVESLGFQKLESILKCLQTLWGGYGELGSSLYRLVAASSLNISKLPKPEHHPKGWNSELSHQRKLRSYQVELNWYKAEREPQCLG